MEKKSSRKKKKLVGRVLRCEDSGKKHALIMRCRALRLKHQRTQLEALASSLSVDDNNFKSVILKNRVNKERFTLEIRFECRREMFLGTRG